MKSCLAPNATIVPCPDNDAPGRTSDSPSSTQLTTAAIGGIAAGASAFLIVVFLFFFLLRRRRRRKSDGGYYSSGQIDFDVDKPIHVVASEQGTRLEPFISDMRPAVTSASASETSTHAQGRDHERLLPQVEREPPHVVPGREGQQRSGISGSRVTPRDDPATHRPSLDEWSIDVKQRFGSLSDPSIGLAATEGDSASPSDFHTRHEPECELEEDGSIIRHQDAEYRQTRREFPPLYADVLPLCRDTR